MKVDDSVLLLAATDLSIFSSCRRATLLDREVAHGRAPAPPKRDDPAMRLLQERGDQHEARYREALEAKYQAPAFCVSVGPLVNSLDWERGSEQTVAAMKSGAPRRLPSSADAVAMIASVLATRIEFWMLDMD